MRIVSMIASSTEMVYALGCGEFLVGRSHECDFPEIVKDLPVTTELKFVADGTSYQIDERVKGILQEGLSVYRVKGDLLKDLAPDVILTQTQCEVCAVSLRDVEDATCQWLGSKPRIVSLHPNALEDLWKDITLVAEALQVEPQGKKLIGALKQRIEDLRLDTFRPTKEKLSKPRVACIEWLNPLMAAGNWVPELVSLAGGINLLGEAGKHSPGLEWSELKRLEPDVILIMPCGFGIPQSVKELFNLTEHPLWPTLKAVKEGRVYIVDGNQYFNRPGPRLVDSLEILIEIIHGEGSNRKFEGTGWLRV